MCLKVILGMIKSILHLLWFLKNEFQWFVYNTCQGLRKIILSFFISSKCNISYILSKQLIVIIVFVDFSISKKNIFVNNVKACTM